MLVCVCVVGEGVEEAEWMKGRGCTWTGRSNYQWGDAGVVPLGSAASFRTGT